MALPLLSITHHSPLPRYISRRVFPNRFTLGVLYYGVNMGMSPGKVFYFTCVSITTVGYGDVVPESDPDKLFTCE